MFSSSVLSWLFTGVFVLTGLYSLYRFARLVSGAERAGDRATELAHLLMSLAMVGMTWAWTGGPDSPSGAVQLAVFGLFAAWFASRMLVAGHRIDTAYHLVMTVSMVWMVATMPVLMGAMPGGHAGHDTQGGHDMHGGSGAGVSPAVAAPVAAPGWVVAVTVGLAVLLVVAAGWWIVRGVRGRGGADGGPDHDRRADAVCHLFMSLGMAGMFLAML